MELTKEQQVEEVRGKIQLIITDGAIACEEALGVGETENTPRILTDAILSLVVIEAKNQELPEEPEFYNDWGGQSGREGYVSAQQDMLRAGFCKVIRVKGEKE